MENEEEVGERKTQKRGCILTFDCGKNDHVGRAAHREAVSGTVIHSVFDTWHYEVL
jgi:hypothetical protein